MAKHPSPPSILENLPPISSRKWQKNHLQIATNIIATHRMLTLAKKHLHVTSLPPILLAPSGALIAIPTYYWPSSTHPTFSDLACLPLYNTDFHFLSNNSYIKSNHWWQHSSYILAKFWLHFGNILATFWLHFGYILATFWLHLGYLLATFWLHSG